MTCNNTQTHSVTTAHSITTAHNKLDNPIMYYPLNEIFATIQGEGYFAGTPSIFLRLHGCDVGCSWCDTKHTWKLIPKQQTNFDDITNKTESSPTWANVELTMLIDHIHTNTNYAKIKHVVITGGEPTLYDLTPLCLALEQLGKYVQIETSGTETIKATPDTWITLSPKIDMPRKKVVLESALRRANEIKMPVTAIADIEKLQQLLLQNIINPQAIIMLQPVSCDAAATALCIKECMEHQWRLSIQTHKYTHIR
jgi:7-carboxy-7-deazaguanine synthase